MFSYSCSYIEMGNNDMWDNNMDTDINYMEGNLSNKWKSELSAEFINTSEINFY